MSRPGIYKVLSEGEEEINLAHYLFWRKQYKKVVKLLAWFNFGKKEIPEIVDTPEMKKAKSEYFLEKEKTKHLEMQLIKQKRKEKIAKIDYQHQCDHHVLKTGKINPSNFDTYFVKCENCGAELFDHATAINYLNTVITLLGKIPKAIEPAVVNHLESYDIDLNYSKIYKSALDLVEECERLRNNIYDIKSTTFNTKLKEYVYDNDKKGK